MVSKQEIEGLMAEYGLEKDEAKRLRKEAFERAFNASSGKVQAAFRRRWYGMSRSLG